MKKKRYVLMWLFLLLPPFLQGCGTAEGGIAVRELNQLNVVMTTGVDYDPKQKKFIVSIQSVKPAKEKKAGITPEVIYTTRATGDTIMEATKKMRAQTSGKLIWFHSKIIILGKALTESKALSEAVDFFARNREIRFSSWVLIAKNTAEEIVNTKPVGEVTMGDELSGIINNQPEWGGTVVVSLRDVLNAYVNPYEGFITGQVGKMKGKDGKDQVTITGGVVINSSNLNQNPSVTRLSKKEIRALRLIHKVGQQEAEMIYPVSLIKENDQKVKKFNTAVQVKIASRKQSAVIENGRPRIKLDLKLEATILESGTREDLMQKETIDQMERMIGGEMRRDMQALLNKVQKRDKVDIFGFSSLIHRQHKHYWYQSKGQWKEIYPTIPVDIHFQWSMLRNGIIVQVKEGGKK
ncbi:Ger(x)C family spore germination protein [Aneurinibacillus sp. BA2021]|nr:Ger(x)C family spore germination protein [Aneurinibacillus sp. BA2021]